MEEKDTQQKLKASQQYANELEERFDNLLKYYFKNENTDLIGQNASKQNLRKKLVQAMNLSLQYWIEATGKSKTDLAEESNAWTVSTDKDNIRTRTFDKYLSIETIPKNPRVLNVIKTVKFILKFHPVSEDQIKNREILLSLIDQISG